MINRLTVAEAKFILCKDNQNGVLMKYGALFFDGRHLSSDIKSVYDSPGIGRLCMHTAYVKHLGISVML